MASALDLTTDLFRSNIVRKLATGGRFNRAIGGLKTLDDNGDGGILAKVWNAVLNIGKGIGGALVKVGGFLLTAITGGFQWTWTALVTQLQSAAMFLWNFNFNATDTELDAQFAQFQSILGGLAGGTIGNALGWMVCGAVPGLVMVKFNKLLGARILAEVGEEATEELLANLRVLVMQSSQLAFRWSAVMAFKAGRRTIKNVLKDPNGPWAKLYKNLGGDLSKVQQWGEQGSKPWSFAIALDTWIESIQDNFWQSFTEELIEEFFDSCSEAFYVVAQNADQYAMERKLNKGSILGQQEVVEITPNREYEEEKIILAGPQELIKPVIVQTMVQHQLLDERDLGMWVGEPLRETLKTVPVPISMRIIMSSQQGTLSKAKRVQITIPDVDRAKLDWELIKQAVGGQNGYMWGRFKGTATLSKGNKFEVYAATDGEAVDLLNALAVFSRQDILGITVLEEKREGTRKTLDALYKEPTRVFPYVFTIVNQQKILNEESGYATLSGIYKRKTESNIPLHTLTRPDDFNEKLAELFYIPGDNG